MYTLNVYMVRIQKRYVQFFAYRVYIPLFWVSFGGFSIYESLSGFPLGFILAKAGTRMTMRNNSALNGAL